MLQIPSEGYQHIPEQWTARVYKEFPSSCGIAHIPSSGPVNDNKLKRKKMHTKIFLSLFISRIFSKYKNGC